MIDAYIAAPFFNTKQLEIVETIKDICKSLDIKIFSPKDESMFKQGDDPRNVLNKNCCAILLSDLVIVVTDDKDVGTIWEAGFAYASNVDIIYLWLGYEPHMKFNIMLAASGGAVVHSYDDLKKQLTKYAETRTFLTTPNEGMLHE